MRKFIIFLSSAALLLGMNSCYLRKNLVYFQDIDQKNGTPMTASYETVIRKDDDLRIMVTATDKTVTQPFNLSLSENVSTGTSQYTISYTVDQNGEIDFPVLGTIKVEGLTRAQLKEYLIERLSEYIKDPMVIIKFENFKFTILGEIKSPGNYTIPTEHTTILQAIAMAGDLPLTAKRNDILLIREVDGKLTSGRINLKNCDIFSSEYYYLQQNDLIYVTPSANKVFMENLSAYTTGLGLITSTITAIALIMNFAGGFK